LIVLRFAPVAFTASATVMRPCSRHSSNICTESSGRSPKIGLPQVLRTPN